mmetsp:Transcript_60587/g.131325  ORF Transcript_60587/g.131325 Transcript_60587/m.131325 type:complete len:227 (-) Transcript_60587:62-742(-)
MTGEGGGKEDRSEDAAAAGLSRLQLEESLRRSEADLAAKTKLLSEVLKVHWSLEARFAALEEGLTWKDAQLEAYAKRNEEADLAMAELKERVHLLEEEKGVLRTALLERADENERLRRLIEARQRSPSPRRNFPERGEASRRFVAATQVGATWMTGPCATSHVLDAPPRQTSWEARAEDVAALQTPVRSLDNELLHAAPRRSSWEERLLVDDAQMEVPETTPFDVG